MNKVSTLLLSILAISLFVPLGFVQSSSAMKHRWCIRSYEAHVNSTLILPPSEPWTFDDIVFIKDWHYQSCFYEGPLSEWGDVTEDFWIRLLILNTKTGEGFGIVKWLITVDTSGTLEGITTVKVTGGIFCSGRSFSTEGTGVLEDVRLYVSFDGWHPNGNLALYERWDSGIIIYED